MTPGPDPARAELLALLGVVAPFRRTVVARTREKAGLPQLSEAQVEVLRAVDRSGTATPREIAELLAMAPSTVSNLLRPLLAAELLQQLPVPGDQRSKSLSVTALARDQLARFDAAAAEVLSEASAALSAADRAVLGEAAGALERLLAEVRDR
ncbi:MULTISPECIES: MarR family winged helix-turn-helix transcriptional regulator [Brevibacterium]|uniref:HTH marR-type domain-containing protein n=2 Tax=Brevibacterium TaxID=1696 RepID=A0ABP9U240_9MICO